MFLPKNILMYIFKNRTHNKGTGELCRLLGRQKQRAAKTVMFGFGRFSAARKAQPAKTAGRFTAAQFAEFLKTRC